MYLSNLLKLARRDFSLNPQVAAYYVTTQCNLNCAYCEDFGARRNPQTIPPPPLETAQKILRVIRSGVARLWLTGGEPLLHSQIEALLRFAKRELRFKEISLITNGTLLAEHPALPQLLNRLIISLDSIDARALDSVSLPASRAEGVIAAARELARRQKRRGFQLCVNAVITPETLPGMEALIQFCEENRIWLSFSPQAANNLPRYELVVSKEYRAFIEKAIEIKKRGGRILGSFAYLKTLRDQTPYECYPTLVPRVYPDGWLAYPCRPMEKAGGADGSQGGKAANLLTAETWDEAWRIARKKYGEAPTACASCFQQCYAEPSLMQARPLDYLRERIRGVDLSGYVPG